MDRPVRLRKENRESDDDEPDFHGSNADNSASDEESSLGSDDEVDSAEEDDHDDDDEDEEAEEAAAAASLKEISFGALAEAQAAAQASMSRSRTIFTPSAAVTKSRDPRFDPAVLQHSSSSFPAAAVAANKNYAFLTSYQAAEILEVAELKRQLMSIEAKVRNAQARQRQVEILAEHKRQEKAALAEGRKARPYYLKESAVKKQIAEERRESMGKQARDKADRRRVKRDKTKAAKEMPRVRRGIEA
ncbi:hypothetical protein DV735_g1609, partial [Chaetothyriales sp. CBS 134920]